MSEQWKFQVRIYLDDAFAEMARSNPGDPAIKPLADILKRHNASSASCSENSVIPHKVSGRTLRFEAAVHTPPSEYTVPKIATPPNAGTHPKSQRRIAIIANAPTAAMPYLFHMLRSDQNFMKSIGYSPRGEG